MSGRKKVVAIAQARMGSTRVPGKVMRWLGGIPVLQWTVNALLDATGIDEIVVATSTLGQDDIINNWCVKNGIMVFRGSESDVLDRFYQCAVAHEATTVLRLTCDCPFLDHNVISEVIKLRERCNAAYASNVNPPSYPDGLDVECFTFEALESAWKDATRPSDRDCVTQFIVRNLHRFKSVNLRCPIPGLEKERWVLDTEEDWKFCTAIVDEIEVVSPTYLDILNVVDKHPFLRDINNKSRGEYRNERFHDALANEEISPRTFERSGRVFRRAIQTIPFGAQTFSKSHLQFPAQQAPLYCTHGDGARIFDVDGNDYIDLVNGLLPVVLGYRDPDVDYAIRDQLDRGISFSLATELEAQLSEILCSLIPCAEMVKLGKSGTDVTTAAIRLARAYTRRDHVLLSGYHGWADWSMSPTARNLGIPGDVRSLSHQIKFGDIDSALPYFDKQAVKIGGNEPYAKLLEIESQLKKNWVAAVIVEPNGDPEYLKKIRAACDYYGALLIFDEVITGFRYDMGGAQKLFDVTPDLACFGKSMANGMPISALVGRKEIMKKCEPPDNIFYSGTFFGETLSIAAAIATIKKMEECNVIEHLWKTGAHLEAQIARLVLNYELTDVVKLGGEAPRITIDFNERGKARADQIRTIFMREMIQNGVLIINSNNVSYSHKDAERIRIVKAYRQTLAKINEALHDGTACNVDVAHAQAPLRATA